LVVGATEEVRHALILDDIVHRTPDILPILERKRILGVDSIATAISVVLVTCGHDNSPVCRNITMAYTGWTSNT